MTCKRVTTLTLVLAAALAGCGNYSNEDLEYMNAVPDRDALAANIPPSCVLAGQRSGAVEDHARSRRRRSTGCSTCSWASSTRSAPTRRRSACPTSASGVPCPPRDSRAGNGGSSSRATRPRPRISPTRWSSSASAPRQTPGPRCSPGGSRHGQRRAPRRGWLSRRDRRAARCAGYPFDNGGERINTIDVTYSTREFPISVVVDFVQFTDSPSRPPTRSITNTERRKTARGRCGSSSRVPI